MAKAFIVYSHRDERWREALEAHLSPLRREGVLETWHDRKLQAGEHVDETIDANLEAADVVLLMVSADFLASDYCYEVELRRALERHQCGEARVIPVIVRECMWHQSPFGRLNAVPRDGRSIASAADADAALTEVARAVRQVVTGGTGTSTAGGPKAPLGRSQSQPSDARSNADVVPPRIRREFTDRDRDAFRDQAFDTIARFFEASLAAIESAEPHAEVRFRRPSDDRFTATVYVNGNVKAECRIWIGERPLADTICFSWDARGNGGINEQLTVVDTGYELRLRPLGIASHGGERAELSPEEAAQLYWNLLMRRLTQ